MITSTFAKEDDGTIQIIFTIPENIIDAKKKEITAKLAEDITVPGFRKGKAPTDIAASHLDQTKVLQNTLNEILPQAFTEAIKDNKLQPAMYPKFEIIKDEAPIEIRATTCELPVVEVGNYKKLAKDALLAASKEKNVTKELKEQRILEAFLTGISITIPRVLLEEEVNIRLTDLLSRLEKLGLTLEGYLGSLNKKPQDLRQEYEKNAKDSISIELILGKIAELEKTQIDPEKLADALKASDIHNDDHQKHIIHSVLKKRAVVDSLLADNEK